MAIENILETIFPGSAASNLKSGRWTAAAKREQLLESQGLHITDPRRAASCPLINSQVPPIRVIEGFRNGRYVSSSLFTDSSYHVLTSISCLLPVFSCRLKQGIPRMIKSPVALPLDRLKKMGDAVIVSDGSSIHSRRSFRSENESGMLRKQLEEVFALEELISSI